MTTLPDPEARYAATVAKVYRSDTVEVTWEPGYCIHVAACIRGDARVFDPNRRPWIDVTAADAARIVEVARLCPTGALHARLLSDAASEPAPSPMNVQARRNGPLFVRGVVQITDADGNLVREDTRVALCRCGQSSNKPFCDGTHRTVNFRSEEISNP
jgi:CDGSH-type Zn-finger protein/uncharacterized Fe-S cluster protein YjdI